MIRSIFGVAVCLSGWVACGGVAPDDPSPVAGDYFPVKITVGVDECGLAESIRALTDAKYSFGRKMLDERSESWDTGRNGSGDLEDAIETGGSDLWNLCRGEFPEFQCNTQPTLVHLDRLRDAAVAGSGCSLEDLPESISGEAGGLFLNEKELILKESIRIRCGTPDEGGDDTAAGGDVRDCEARFSMRLKR